jgi:t-SNARE complex subunit (syntaxin)
MTPPQAPLDLAPVHTQITELQTHTQDLRTQMQEQGSSLKRMEDQLEMVREATDRNTLEQQELIEDLKAVGNKVNLFALLLFAMLIVSLVLNVMLFLHIKQVLP